MSNLVIVARSTSKRGGRCPSCDQLIARLDPIFKIDTGERGITTRAGNGAGVWVCSRCATPDTD